MAHYSLLDKQWIHLINKYSENWSNTSCYNYKLKTPQIKNQFKIVFPLRKNEIKSDLVV